MPKLPQAKYREIEKVLKKLGFIPRNTKSSHVVFKHHDGRTTVVPYHAGQIPKGTFKTILDQAGISVDEFLKLL